MRCSGASPLNPNTKNTKIESKRPPAWTLHVGEAVTFSRVLRLIRTECCDSDKEMCARHQCNDAGVCLWIGVMMTSKRIHPPSSVHLNNIRRRKHANIHDPLLTRPGPRYIAITYCLSILKGSIHNRSCAEAGNRQILTLEESRRPRD
jgi:hypothetical protein